MRLGEQAPAADVIGLGLAFGAAGLYFVLGAAGVLPLPPSDSPAIFMALIGASFLLSGIVCVFRARDGLVIERSPDDFADARARWQPRMLAVAGAGSLTIVGTWLAISAGPRSFNLAMPLAQMPTVGDQIGRTVFALAAVVGLIYLIAFTIGAVRMLFDRAR